MTGEVSPAHAIAADPPAQAAPRPKARAAGVFYLLTFLVGGVALVVGGKLVVPGNAAATATNIMTHQTLFRLHLVGDLSEVACYVVVTALLYDVFKPVNENVSLLAALFSLVGCALQAAFSCLYDVAPFVVLGGARYLRVFSEEQLQALALILLNVGAQGFNANLVFFGCYCVVIGYLILRSTFLPNMLGALMALGGLRELLSLGRCRRGSRRALAPAWAQGAGRAGCC